VSSGIVALDTMLDGKGFYRGSSILISGTAGTGKSTFAAHFANSICAAGNTCLYLAFEESPDQIMRNMRTIGIDLGRWVAAGKLRFHASRPSLHGLEMHLVAIHKQVQALAPAAIVIDPVSNLTTGSNHIETHGMLVRLIDYLKRQQITAFMIHLAGPDGAEATAMQISSIIDTWIFLRHIDDGAVRSGGLTILKSRGMPHSMQMHRFSISRKGVVITDDSPGSRGRALQS